MSEVEVTVIARDLTGVEFQSDPETMSRADAGELAARYEGGLWTEPGFVLPMKVALVSWGKVRETTLTTRTLYLAGQHLLSIEVRIWESMR
jgi:hypothetical protein